jgi:hypothetical protein
MIILIFFIVGGGGVKSDGVVQISGGKNIWVEKYVQMISYELRELQLESSDDHDNTRMWCWTLDYPRSHTVYECENPDYCKIHDLKGPGYFENT